VIVADVAMSGVDGDVIVPVPYMYTYHQFLWYRSRIQVILRREGLGAVLVLGTAYALGPSRGHPDNHTRKPLHASGTCRHLQAIHSGVKLAYCGLNSWMVKERLHRGKEKCLLHMTLCGFRSVWVV